MYEVKEYNVDDLRNYRAGGLSQTLRTLKVGQGVFVPMTTYASEKTARNNLASLCTHLRKRGCGHKLSLRKRTENGVLGFVICRLPSEVELVAAAE